MRKREVVDIHVGDEDGVHGTGGQQGRFGERHEPHAGHIRIALVARVRKVGRLRATASGDGQAIQHRDGGGLANVQLVSDIGQGLDGLGGHGHLDSGADRPVPPTECAGGQGAGDGTHGLEGRDWTLLPQIRDDARAHSGYLRIGLGLVGALTLGRRLALIALQRAQDRLRRQRSVGSDLLVEHPGGIGIHAGKRRVKPIGELRRRPPRRRALGVLPRILHAGNHIGQGSKLTADCGLAEPRGQRAFRADSASRQAGRDLFEHLGGAGGGHHHVTPIPHEIGKGARVGGAAGMRACDLEELWVPLEARRRAAVIEPDRLDGGVELRCERTLVGVEEQGDLARTGDGPQKAHHVTGQTGNIAHGDEARARGGAIPDKARQDGRSLRSLDEAALGEHVGVSAHQAKHRTLRFAVGLGLPHPQHGGGGDLGQQGLGDLGDEAHRSRVIAQRGDLAGISPVHEGRDEHAALERRHHAAAIAEELPQPLDPSLGRCHVDARADARVCQGATAHVALGERGHQQRGTAAHACGILEQRYLGTRECRHGLRRIDFQPHAPHPR